MQPNWRARGPDRPLLAFFLATTRRHDLAMRLGRRLNISEEVCTYIWEYRMGKVKKGYYMHLGEMMELYLGSQFKTKIPKPPDLPRSGDTLTWRVESISPGKR